MNNELWVARDKDGSLNLFLDKPKRGECNWSGDWLAELSLEKYWSEDVVVDNITGFEDLSWEDEPRKVELVNKDNEETREFIKGKPCMACSHYHCLQNNMKCIFGD